MASNSVSVASNDQMTIKRERRARYLPLWISALILAASAPWFSEVHGFTLGQPAPEISGGPWINSPPLTLNELKDKVVVVEFWTYG